MRERESERERDTRMREGVRVKCEVRARGEINKDFNESWGVNLHYYRLLAHLTTVLGQNHQCFPPRVTFNDSWS